MQTYDIQDDIDRPSRTLPAVWQRRVAADPAAPFLWFAGRLERTVGAFDGDVARAAALLRRMGLQKGQRVCVLMRNSTTLLAVMLACWEAGAVVVPLSAQLMGSLLADQIQRSRPALLAVDDELSQRLPALSLPVAMRSAFEAEPQGAQPRLAQEPSAPDEPALILFTSGSTGPSKGCVLSHHFCVYYGWVFWRYMGYEASDTIYSCLPLNHVHALFASFLPAVLSGAQYSFSERFSASRYWHEIAESGATTCSAIGPMASILLAQPASEVEGRLRVRLAHIAPAPPRVQEFERRFGLRVASTLYGMTEAMIFPPDPQRPPVAGVIGTAPADWDVAIVDAGGEPVPVGQPGELIARPRKPGILFDGYFEMPQQTLEACRGLWYHTGDICRRDADGVYWFMGRARDVIRRGGENVSAYEVELILSGHLGIAELAAVAVPLPGGEEDIALFAKCAEGARVTQEDLRAYCEESLPRFMRPGPIVVGQQDLPKTASGKIDKVALRASFQARAASPAPGTETAVAHDAPTKGAAGWNG